MPWDKTLGLPWQSGWGGKGTLAMGIMTAAGVDLPTPLPGIK